MNKRLVVKNLGRQDYEPVWKAMHTFTDERDENTCDEVWLVEHNPVFTQGQAGKEEHVLAAGDIPIVKSDRGGQVTYHGPGQLVAYVLINLRRKNIGVRELVTHIENTVINTLSHFNVESAARPDAPGVYVDNKKICSLGLRIRKGCSFHGLALNINMDLSPFLRINPCGYAGMEMIQLHDLVKDNMTVENKAEHVEDVHPLLIKELTTLLDYTDIEYLTESSNHE
ncbi:lipoyl(octanoyl) transferase LipB [Aliivibrio fischeri]|uniref:Octanoyltransferase n=3 Tax=Aliivibrio fischeri TaxID=668 RepID=LIPB_ALIF1|nr:lipoyl(octanoyl) transferase LipB [Aliivibrio fischeri]Q5E6V8.1 RecName: Full=Octanoyltransferase; AltName: Full=Lipoate-protein ligase B; AltName: Full=Lipoyl/octanoyl transferase; AltName: Full=Octanoyl-[acyl-carrier-protein]-protein N-octanoyltransferase [Aliivibrio fischeri ES114]AAW85238.1 lipoyl-protein ligase [Aliivibrio fischeri ES114]KLU77768.1 octanoyltransferase [Aliivibrio fischeri]MBP3141298.1 lipoyl(octanoyl) transferase LipB [Aliivibrio fischeri]MBP3155405.1 lipoyl(octanoyl) 